MLLANKTTQAPSQQTIAAQVYLREKGGSLQLDMQSYVRRIGWLAYRPPATIDALLAALQANEAVIVLQNLSFNFYPRWHYALALGFDARTQQLILHSGRYQNYRLKLKTFARTWARVDNWALLAIDPNQLQKYSPADKNWLDIDALFAELVNADEVSALKNPPRAYRQFIDLAARLDADQKTIALAWFRLGNHLYSTDKQAALQAFFKSAKLDATVWAYNNLALNAHELDCEALAKAAIHCALARDFGNKNAQQTYRQIFAQPIMVQPSCKVLPICQNCHKTATAAK